MIDTLSTALTTNDENARLTYEALRRFTGDFDRYRHPLNPTVLYTPGVKYLAEAGQAYWLVDAIASYFEGREMKAAMQSDYRIRSMQFWRLKVAAGRGLLTAEADAGEIPFITQEIPYTDFPLEMVEIWAGFNGQRWTLYLPSEH